MFALSHVPLAPGWIQGDGTRVRQRDECFPTAIAESAHFLSGAQSGYAEQIARDWNTREEDAAGYVTRLELPDSFSERYERHVVGGSIHEEWWVPAEELAEFNRAIIQPITVEAASFGALFTGLVCSEAGLKGKNAREQFIALAHHLDNSSFDVWCESCQQTRRGPMGTL